MIGELTDGLLFSIYACPLCCHTMVDMQSTWRSLDLEIANTPMPEEYRDVRVTVLCRDCHKVHHHLQVFCKCPNRHLYICKICSKCPNSLMLTSLAVGYVQNSRSGYKYTTCLCTLT